MCEGQDLVRGPLVARYARLVFGGREVASITTLDRKVSLFFYIEKYSFLLRWLDSRGYPSGSDGTVMGYIWMAWVMSATCLCFPPYGGNMSSNSSYLKKGPIILCYTRYHGIGLAT